MFLIVSALFAIKLGLQGSLPFTTASQAASARSRPPPPHRGHPAGTSHRFRPGTAPAATSNPAPRASCP
jgi:hypothetical protein